VKDISKIYLCSYVHTNNSEQISFVVKNSVTKKTEAERLPKQQPKYVWNV